MAHKKTNFSVGSDSLLEKIPENILYEILSKLEDETEILTTLCTLTCVSQTLHSTVNKYLSSLSSIDLSAFSIDSNTLNGIIRRLGKMKKIKLDCLRLNDLSIKSLLGRDVEELVLLKCSSLSQDIVLNIARVCPNLRVLTVELSGFTESIHKFDDYLRCLRWMCPNLQTLFIKVVNGKKRGSGEYMGRRGVSHMMSQSVKVLMLDMRVFHCSITFGPTLTHISLLLDVITNCMVRSVVQSCPLLVELELIDVPKSVDQLVDELSDEGVQSLVDCRHLTSLSLVRSQQRLLDSPFGYKTAIPFRDITDMGMTLLSEGCKRLESVRVDWFSEVTNAGFTSILSSCLNLKKFEINNSSRLTDLAFIDFSKVQRPLVEVKLMYCKSITCKGVGELATTGNSIEILNLYGCQRVADSCLSSVSYLTSLTSLNLGSTNVTDDGMDVLGKGNAPISYLSLRGCRWVTDEGITSLLGSEGKINNTLSFLDLGYMQRISDNAITIIADACAGLVQLCIRNCLLITDEAVKTLAFRGRLQHESKLLRRLDISKCPGVSVKSFEFLKKPLFRGLQWIGIGETRLIRVGDDRLSEINRERPWLTICRSSCEVGCLGGWQNHKF